MRRFDAISCFSLLLERQCCDKNNQTQILVGMYKSCAVVTAQCVHTSVVEHRPTSADIVARVETMSTFVRRRRLMQNDASIERTFIPSSEHMN